MSGDEKISPPAPGATPRALVAPGPDDADRQRLQVKLESFQGPLDLLLHLVRVNEVDVYDIPVVEIARQYDEHLEMMREFDLNVAGEFLVLAATLTYIKSRMLLPQREGEDGEQDDPRLPLTEMLVEHQRFLLAAEELGVRADVQGSLWTRPAATPPDMEDEVTLEVSLYDLVRAFQRVLDNLAAITTIELEPEGVSVERRMAQVMERLEAEGTMEFSRLFPQESRKRDRITTFLALLELLRLGMITAFQVRRFGDIRLARTVRPASNDGETQAVLPEEE